jgi:hypothetical protein
MDSNAMKKQFCVAEKRQRWLLRQKKVCSWMVEVPQKRRRTCDVERHHQRGEMSTASPLQRKQIMELGNSARLMLSSLRMRQSFVLDLSGSANGS